MRALFLLACLAIPAQAQVHPVCIPYVPITSTSEYIWSDPKTHMSLNGIYYQWTCWSLSASRPDRTYTYVGLPSELPKIGGRIATIVKAKSPLLSLQTLPERITILPITDPSLANIVGELPK